MGKGSCVLVPKVKGTDKPSKLYLDLNNNPNLKHDRMTVNYIYASYLQKGVADAMDAAGYERDINEEHLAKDVYEYFDIALLRMERLDITVLKQEAGIIDSSGNVIKYYNSLEALQVANNYNRQSKGFVASVHKNGDHHIIMLQEKNAQTLHILGEMNMLQDNYDTIKEHIDSNTHDGFLEYLLLKFPKHFSVVNLPSNLTWLSSVSSVRNDVLSALDMEIILNFANDSQISRLESKYGNIEEAAKVLYSNYHGGSVSSSELTLLESSLSAGRRNILNLNLITLKNNLKTPFDYDDLSYLIKETIEELNSEYHIDKNSTRVVSNEINTLSDAAEHAAVLLHRRLGQLDRQQQGGNDIEKEAIKSTIQKLMVSIEQNRDYSSILDFLNEVSLLFDSIPDLLNQIDTIGQDQFDVIKKSSNIIMEVELLLGTYKQILEELSVSNEALVDINMLDTSQQEEIVNISNKLLQLLNNYNKKLNTYKKTTFINILTYYFGQELPDGRDMVNLAELALAESTIFDHLYAWSRVSDPVVSLMGKITRDAQDNRSHLMFEYLKRLQVCEEKLKKAGVKDTKWMYTRDGYIVSPYDWETYHEKRNKKWGSLKKLNLTAFEIEELMSIWEETHTQEVVVDEVSGRTERVPIYLLNDVPSFVLQYDDTDLVDDLTRAKSIYYREMMQIKGELGTLLPHYALHHFLPPQVRRDFTDTEFKNWFKAAWAKITNIIHRENDEEFLKENALYNGDDYTYIKSDAHYDGTVKKSIPIFYVKKLKDQNELLKNFSGAMSFFAKTAINYYCMNDILDTILFMGDMAINRKLDTSSEKKKAEIIENDHIKIANKLWENGRNSKTTAIIEGFIDKEFFNVRLVNQGTWAKVVKTLLKYASIKGLSFNVLGAAANILAGEHQILIETLGNLYFNLADWAGAQALLFGDKVLKSPGHIIDFFTNNTNVYNTLVGNLFDPQMDAFEEMGQLRFKKGLLRHVLGNINTHFLYGIGENLLHYTIMYAMLLHKKVLHNGKKISLYNAFEKVDMPNSSVKTLKFKDGVTTLLGEPLTNIHCDFVKNFRGEIRTANQRCNGSMSEEDKGLISRYLWGRCLIQMRQWMVEHYSRRYRGLHYDGSTDSFSEGAWVTAYKWIIGDMDRTLSTTSKRGFFRLKVANAILKKYNSELEKRRDGTSTMSESAFKAFLHLARLAENRKKNINRFFADASTTVLLYILGYVILPPPEETKGESWAYRFFNYQTKRLASSALSSTPVGIITEGKNIYKSPAYVGSTINGLSYPIYGLALGDHTEEYRRGEHAGENKYKVKTLKYTVPFYLDVSKLVHLQENNDIFIPFDPDAFTRY